MAEKMIQLLSRPTLSIAPAITIPTEYSILIIQPLLEQNSRALLRERNTRAQENRYGRGAYVGALGPA